MKKLLLLAFVLLALPSFATILQPLGHSMCLNGLESTYCNGGTKLYYTDIGCACLSQDQFFSPRTCERARITCEDGTQFLAVHHRHGSKHLVYAGCGCFSVNHGMIPNGIHLE